MEPGNEAGIPVWYQLRPEWYQNVEALTGYLATDPALVWQAHFLAELGEAGILPELGE